MPNAAAESAEKLIKDIKRKMSVTSVKGGASSAAANAMRRKLTALKSMNFGSASMLLSDNGVTQDAGIMNLNIKTGVSGGAGLKQPKKSRKMLDSML